MADRDVNSVILIGTDGEPYEVSAGGVSQADGSAFTANTSSVAPIGGLYEATPTSVNDGDVGALGMTASRVLKAALHDAAGSAITTLPVSLASVPSHAVTNAGTFAVQAAGDVAHDAADSGSPVKIGGYAASSAPTAVSVADRVNGWFGLNGQQVVAAGISNTNHTGANALGMIDTSGTPRPLAVGMYNGSNYDSLRGTAAGGLTVSGSGTAGTAASGVQTVQGIASMTPIQVGDNSASLSVDWNGTQPVTGSGTATGALRVELPTNGTGKVGLNAGTNAIGKLAANSGVDIGDVDVTSIAAGTNLIGDVGIQPRTSGGLTTFMASGSDGSSILVATAQAVKASAGQLYGYYVYNPEAAVTFLHWYNTAAASVTVGTTNPMMSFAIPAGAAANLSFPAGVVFSNAGWSVAATTTAAGNSAPATGLSLVAWYK